MLYDKIENECKWCSCSPMLDRYAVIVILNRNRNAIW